MKTLVIGLVTLLSADAKKYKPFQKPNTINIENPNTLRQIIEEGLDVTTESKTIGLRQAAGTGYMWLYQESPAGCISIVQSIVDESNGRKGGPKANYLEVSKAQESDNCQLSLVYERPWLFKGFGEDGGLKSDSTALKSF